MSFQQDLKDLSQLGGKDEIWDYSTLTNIQAYQPIVWMSIEDGSAEQKSQYPNATYIEVNNNGNKMSRFFQVDANSHKFLGFTAGPRDFKLSEPFDYYTYPMEFGKEYQSHFKYADTNNGEGTYTLTYDGVGLLKLPTADYDSVYRLHLLTKTVFPDDKKDTTITSEYQFIQRSTGLLLFKVLELGAGASSTMRSYSFTYYVSPITSVDIDLSRKSALYPNPATNQISIDVPKNIIVNYEIMNLNGRAVVQSAYNKVINISNLPIGSYFIRAELQSGENIIKQFIKK
jgi:hypothetical protein